MRLRHFDYIKLVKESFKKKLKHNQLSPLLAHSTPGNIRLECAHVYEERAEKKDEPMLRSYFGPGEPGRKYLKTIQEFDVNKLKTLVSLHAFTGYRKFYFSERPNEKCNVIEE